MFIPLAQPVTEAYTGAMKELHQVEKEIAKLIPIINQEGIDINELNNSSETRNIKSLLEKAFGTTVYFKWAGTAGAMMNAYTVASAIHLDEKMHIYVSPSLIKLGKLDAGEVTAIILHEVGHNQINAMLAYLSRNYAAVLQSIVMPQYAIPIHVSTLVANILLGPVNRLYYKAINKFNEYVFKYAKPLGKLYNRFLELKHIVAQSTSPATGMFTGAVLTVLMVGRPLNLLLSVVSASNPFRYVEEKEADRFAAEHGYGPQLMSGLDKMTAIETANFVLNHTDNAAIHLIYDITEVQMSYLQLFFGAYPSTQNRMRSNMDILQKAATDPSLQPELRKSAKAELKRAKEIYEAFAKLEGDQKKKKFFSAMNRSIMEEVFQGKGDTRELFMHLTKPIQRK